MLFNSMLPGFLLTLVLFSVLSGNLVADDEFVVETIAFSGLDAPGIAGANFDAFTEPIVNDSGQVVFKALLEGIGVGPDNDEVIYSGTKDSLALIARKGDLIPDLGGGLYFSSLSDPKINDFGHAAFASIVSGLGPGFFTDVNGALETVVIEGDPIPGVAGLEIDNIVELTLGPAGHIGFYALLDGPGVNTDNDNALFQQNPGEDWNMIARAGDPIPGIPGVHFHFPTINRINSHGTFVFRSGMLEGGSGIFVWSNGSIEAVALTGDPAPGAPLGVNFNDFDFSRFDFNDAGQLAMTAELTNGKHALFSDSSGVLQIIAMGGEPAPGGLPLDPDFGSFDFVAINENGEVLFRADFEGQTALSDHAIYLSSGGSLELIAYQGDAAPGTEPGVKFDELLNLSFNDAGQIVFAAALDGDGIDETEEAIYLYSDGELSLIARIGEMFDVDDDPAIEDLREIDQISIADGASFINSMESSLSAAGNVTFGLKFTDLSEGIFTVKSPVLIGDVNGDGVVDLLDVLPFVDALTGGSYVPEADINQDGVLNLLDVEPFVSLLSGT